VDIRRLAALIGQIDAEPVLKWAFIMAVLPAEVAIQLKSMVSVAQ